jgi:hypothetical protein
MDAPFVEDGEKMGNFRGDIRLHVGKLDEKEICSMEHKLALLLIPIRRRTERDLTVAINAS